MIKKIFKIATYIFALIGLFFTIGYFAVRFGFTNTKGVIDNQNNYFKTQGTKIEDKKPIDMNWTSGDEWITFKDSVSKDAAVLTKVESETGVPARYVMTMLAVEQMRLYTSEREIFKQAFAPLKILGSQSQFSWGVMGIKPETAKLIEINLKDQNGEYYLGKSFENVLDFKTGDVDQERFARMTDEHNHYYSYLYGAVYIKEIIQAWEKAGYDISAKPEILGTLYNIGFEHSVPKANPEVGGAEIDINGNKYSFGSLAYNIYYSDELIELFPRK